MSTKIYLDTNAFIEAFERKEQLPTSIWSVLEAVDAGLFSAATSELSFAELLPKLITDCELELVSIYEGLFYRPSLLEVVPINREVLTEAAHLRAKRPALKLPDAIHLATATYAHCSVILSNDRRLDLAGRITVLPIGPDCLAQIEAHAF